MDQYESKGNEANHRRKIYVTHSGLIPVAIGFPEKHADETAGTAGADHAN